MKILDFASQLPDKRIDRKKLHSSKNIIFITIATVMCGAQNREDIEKFGHCKEEFSGKYCLCPMASPRITPLIAFWPVYLPKYWNISSIYRYRPFAMKNPNW